MEYYLAIKKEILLFVTMWINLEDTMLINEIVEKERQILYDLTYVWNLGRWYQRIYLQGSNGETDIENRVMGTGREEERVRCMERVTWKLILPYVK